MHLRIRLVVAIAAALLVAALVAAEAASRTSGNATLQASGGLKGRLANGTCVIPPNPLTARLHKRFVEMSFSRAGTTITITVDAWQTGKIDLATTKADSIGVGSRATSGAASGWFAGWTGTQAPLLSPHGKNQGSGTLVVAKGGHSGTVNATLVGTPGPGQTVKAALHLKGSWTGC